MDKAIIVLKFWIEVVIVLSLRASINFKEIGGKLMDIIFGVVVGIILVVGLGQFGTIPDLGVNITTLAFFTLFAVTGRFVWNLLYIPAKLYNELGGFDDAKLVVIPDTSDTKPEGWFTLQLRNDTKEDIPECYVELKQIMKESEPRYTMIRPMGLWWSSENIASAELRTLPAGAIRKVDIATTNPVTPTGSREMGFRVWNGSDYPSSSDIFHIVLAIRGIYRRSQLNCQFNLDFSYDGETTFVCNQSGKEIELKLTPNKSVVVK